MGRGEKKRKKNKLRESKLEKQIMTRDTLFTHFKTTLQFISGAFIFRAPLPLITVRFRENSATRNTIITFSRPHPYLLILKLGGK